MTEQPAHDAAIDDGSEIDPTNNREARSADRGQSSAVSRAGTSGMTVLGGAPGPEHPDHELGGGGTATGNPVAGVQIDDADREQAVDGDTGPEHPGTRGGSAGHA
jgi:hypothetical protein